MSSTEEFIQPVFFNIELTLQADLKDNKIILQFDNDQVIMSGGESTVVRMRLPFSDLYERLELIKFSCFKAAPSTTILIQKVTINGFDVRYFRPLFSFTMKDNAYVDDRKIEETDNVNFNGILYLETKKNRDRFTWFPFTYSKSKTGMVYRNDDPTWKRYQLEQREFDILAFGCSVTAGTGIEKDRAWPSLLGGDTLNLGVPGAGCDTILNNVKYMIDQKIRYSKIIILFPNAGRRLYRLQKHGIHFNIPMVADKEPDGPINHGKFNIFFDRDELSKYARKKSKELVMKYDPKRDQKIIKRIVKLLTSTGRDFNLSSWSESTYEFLQSFLDKEVLLPRFNEGNDKSVGQDGVHPAHHIHNKWVESIKTQLDLDKKIA